MLGFIENDYVFLNGKSFPLEQVIAMEIDLEVDFRGNILLFVLGLVSGYLNIFFVAYEFFFYGILVLAFGLLLYSLLYTRIRKVMKVHILNGGTVFIKMKETEVEKAKLLIDKFRKQKLVKNTSLL